MRVTEVSCSRSVKVNVGNYEAVDVWVMMKAEPDELDDPRECARALAAQVEGWTLAQVVSIYRQRGQNADPAVLAKRYGLTKAEG